MLVCHSCKLGLGRVNSPLEEGGTGDVWEVVAGVLPGPGRAVLPIIACLVERGLWSCYSLRVCSVACSGVGSMSDQPGDSETAGAFHRIES